MNNTTAIVIGRFQVPSLTPGHLRVLQAAQECERLIVLLGETGGLPCRHDPIPFAARAQMLMATGLVDRCLPIRDALSDETWSANVDALLGATPCRLYASRDGFIPHYKGQWPTVLVDPVQSITGTETRAEVRLLDSADFRAGMIHAQQRPPISYQAVDIGVCRREDRRVLLGRKAMDGDQWRLPGGFVDPADLSLERAAKRELAEEVSHNIATGRMFYLGSYRIDDHRYRASADKVMTALFMTPFLYGFAKASDDLAAADWFSIDDLPPIVPQHAALVTHVTKEFYAA